MQEQNNQPKSRSIKSINAKYYPPKQLDHEGKEIPWSEDPKTLAWILDYATKAEQREHAAKEWEKQQKEQRLQMEQMEKRQRAEREQRRVFANNIPKAQFQQLLSVHSRACGHCSSGLYYYAMCNNPQCLAKTKVSVEPGIAYLRQEIARLNQEIASLKAAEENK